LGDGYRRRKQRGCWRSSTNAPQPHTWVPGTAQRYRLEAAFSSTQPFLVDDLLNADGCEVERASDALPRPTGVAVLMGRSKIGGRGRVGSRRTAQNDSNLLRRVDIEIELCCHFHQCLPLANIEATPRIVPAITSASVRGDVTATGALVQNMPMPP